jgi:predicted ribosome quality control (RQC) complex YloA/Tae2 family protein
MKTCLYEYENQTYRIHCGQSAYENHQLVRQAEREDYWFHLENYPSPHVILEVKNLNIPNAVLLFCANLCREKSKYPHDSVMYTEIKYIKPTKQLGQVTITPNHTRIIKP